MSLENVQEESAAERNPAALDIGSGGVGQQRRNVVAFKFGGSSLLEIGRASCRERVYSSV